MALVDIPGARCHKARGAMGLHSANVDVDIAASVSLRQEQERRGHALPIA